MMRPVFKTILRSIVILSVCLIPAHLIASSEDAESKNISIDTQSFEEVSLSRSELGSRNAAVKVETDRGYGSGTYVTISRRKVVITAAHVVTEVSEVTIVSPSGERVPGSVLFMDVDNDFALISLPKLNTRSPARFTPTRRSFEKIVGDNVCYSGFPSGHDILTIRGSVAGVDRGFLMIQSYAWMGASGSGVFNNFGEFIGVLTAVDVGFFDGSAHIVESIVWIVPISNIETKLLKSIIEEKIPL